MEKGGPHGPPFLFVPPRAATGATSPDRFNHRKAVRILDADGFAYASGLFNCPAQKQGVATARPTARASW
jgi:hypothetical protein